MSIFSGRHYPQDVILWVVRWCCSYGVSYRDLEEMLTERGVAVNHTTIYRRVQKYGPELDKRTRWYRQTSRWSAGFWRVDETCIRVSGKWCYLYRAVTKDGLTLEALPVSECVDCPAESSRVDQWPQDVVGLVRRTPTRYPAGAPACR